MKGGRVQCGTPGVQSHVCGVTCCLVEVRYWDWGLWGCGAAGCVGVGVEGVVG